MSQLFDLNPDDFTNLTMVENEAKTRYDVWKSLRDFQLKSSDWTDGPILTSQGQVRLDIEIVRKEVDEYNAKAYKLGKANKEVYACPVASSEITCKPIGLCVSQTCGF